MPTHAEIVAELAGAYNARDPEQIAALCTEDVELQTILAGLIEGEIYRGAEGIERWLRDEAEIWSERELVNPEPMELPDGRVIGTATIRTRSQAGVALELDAAWIFTFEGDRVARMDAFTDADDAFESAGVER